MKISDGLPQPVTVGEFYLRAILDEIQGLRADLAKPLETQQVTTNDPIRVKEPAKKRV